MGKRQINNGHATVPTGRLTLETEKPMLIAHTNRVNSRPADTHLVNTAEALLTICGRKIDPQTWTYRKRRTDETPTCSTCHARLTNRAIRLTQATPTAA